MKTQKIEVIASIPKVDQDPITDLIGKQFPLYSRLEDEPGYIQINAPYPFEGIIILNPGEYKFV